MDYSVIIIKLLSIIGVSGLLSALLHKEYKNKWVNMLMKVINVLGANVFKAKNK